MPKKTKILFLTLNTFSLTGGIEKVCCSLAKVLEDLSAQIKGFYFNLYAMHDPQSALDTRYINPQHFKGFKNQKARFGLSSIFTGINSDIVILSHINLLILAYLIKNISPKTRIILLAHGIEIWRALPTWKRKFLQEKTEIWAVSKYTATKLTVMHQINAEHIKVVHNCLDPYFDIPSNFEKPDALLSRYKLLREQPILFTLTRLSSQETYKGYDRVFSALPSLIKKFPNLHYLLAGKADQDELNRVRNIINELNLTKYITLVGFINDDELTSYFKLGSVFIMPSTMEGFGIVFIEAAACGTQIIAGNADGSADALLDGALGTLINPLNVEEIESAIEKNLTEKVDPHHIQNLCIANFAYNGYLKKIKELIVTNPKKAA
ncbi:MAG: glycosyltransferase family 1 protein [Chitinophagaceae bacterium]|nr:MAG: glycosyltransferase family 1 protein [Chitinophagaceae bacterium]